VERRNFVKVLAAVPFFGAALARKCESKEYKFSEQWFLDQWELAAKSSWKDLEKEPKPKQALLDDQQAITPAIAKIDLNENRYYNPKWNVNGSWNKAQSRVGLISHLAGANHKFDKSYLNTLSTDQLQKLHDDDHNKKRRTTTRRRWFR
jgi:hypothetical protein